jgi:hypothetical protein
MAYIDKIHDRVVEYIRSRHSLVDVKPKQGLFNFKCFYNSVEFARLNPEYSVVETICIENGIPILHYINKHIETGELYETTLGYQAEYNEYYIIRDIHKNDHKFIGNEFDRSLDAWLHQFTNPVERFLFKIKRVV